MYNYYIDVIPRQEVVCLGDAFVQCITLQEAMGVFMLSVERGFLLTVSVRVVTFALSSVLRFYLPTYLLISNIL